MYALRQLATLAAVADHGTFGRAAVALGYTQSSVSQQIAVLEKEAGGPLFDRPGGPRPVRLTPLGAVVLEHGRELLARAQAMTDAVDRFRAGDGRIDIGTFQTATNVLLPPLIRELRDAHPGCDIRLFEEETDVPDLGEIDLMFFDGPGDGDVERLKVLADPHVLVARPGDFAPGPVELKELDGHPLVAHPAICDQARVEATLDAAGIAPRFVFRTVGNEALLAMVRAGLGAAVMPRLSVTDDQQLSLHPLDPQLPDREIYLLWQAGRTHSPLVAHAIEIARKLAAGLT
ncbi:LysR family transcriptional regulator [Kribbella sandramycini]|uniref:DNA-binding transcriptional LysR family regulator n=1 Tax=Kribbella sandramycini TaxID=60450 RepID=A0A7Y4KY08_9ACTN|nr:LysR family transcriptional regulator [Kribbella sandramycini]MBB6569410.1 DNA-binding transcriptional LysR family regulator [Kribbella sandramycini]NOL40754.1 LysR family transcriptional regulator [Kribbella sandramycini]